MRGWQCWRLGGWPGPFSYTDVIILLRHVQFYSGEALGDSAIVCFMTDNIN